MPNTKLNKQFYQSINSISGAKIIKMVRRDISRPNLTDTDKVILKYIKKRYIDCVYPLAQNRKYFIDVNFENIHPDMTEDELEKNIIIFKNVLRTYINMEIDNKNLINNISAYITKQLRHKGIEASVSFTIYEDINGSRFIYIFYNMNKSHVAEIHNHNILRFYGVYPIKSLTELHNHIIMRSASHNVQYDDSLYKQIYSLYKIGVPAQAIASKYDIYIGRIHEIIRLSKEKYKEREEFTEKLSEFLKEKYSSECTRIMNCLNRYLSNSNITNMEPIIEMIKDEDNRIVYIRGIGVKTMKILREFINEYESTN